MQSTLIYFKACPMCKGDLYLDQDSSGVYGHCFQCGRRYLRLMSMAEQSVITEQGGQPNRAGKQALGEGRESG